MKKLLIGALTAGAVASVALLATNAFFSDTETSSGNTFTAGSLDLILNDVILGQRTPITGPLFTLGDLKPGDLGEKTVELYVVDNLACGFVNINVTSDLDNSCTEPENAAEPSCSPTSPGELNDEVKFAIWNDPNCNNVYDNNEEILVQGPLTANHYYSIGEIPPVSQTNPGKCYGIGYCFGEWKVTQVGDVNKVKCDGSLIGNDSQSDSFVADLIVTAKQKRNQYPNGCPKVGEIIHVLSPTMDFSSTGWAGWSCPAGTQVMGGGTDCSLPLAISQAAKPGVGTYPVYPHYTYNPPEEGWVVQNGGTGQSCKIYVDCL